MLYITTAGFTIRPGNPDHQLPEFDFTVSATKTQQTRETPPQCSRLMVGDYISSSKYERNIEIVLYLKSPDFYSLRHLRKRIFTRPFMINRITENKNILLIYSLLKK